MPSRRAARLCRFFGPQLRIHIDDRPEVSVALRTYHGGLIQALSAFLYHPYAHGPTSRPGHTDQCVTLASGTGQGRDQRRAARLFARRVRSHQSRPRRCSTARLCRASA